MDELKPSGKPFAITKWEVWEAYRKVKANRGAPGVDGVTLEEFDKDLKNNLYKIWNRMSSGSYLPPPVLAVEIPKPHGGGTRILGVPTISDRVAQTVVARRLELKVEPIFHPDSYGYRPYRSPANSVVAQPIQSRRAPGGNLMISAPWHDTPSTQQADLTNRPGHDLHLEIDQHPRFSQVLTSRRLGDQPPPNRQSAIEGSLVDSH